VLKGEGPQLSRSPATFYWIMSAPTSEGVRGMGIQDRGRAPGKENRPSLVSDIDISQLNQSVLC
jgi:hypothetical protein